MNIFKLIAKKCHIHRWSTTHTNRWQHPTAQTCSCNLTREFVYKENADEIKGMPWDKGEWLWSDGTRSEYNV